MRKESNTSGIEMGSIENTRSIRMLVKDGGEKGRGCRLSRDRVGRDEVFFYFSNFINFFLFPSDLFFPPIHPPSPCSLFLTSFKKTTNASCASFALEMCIIPSK